MAVGSGAAAADHFKSSSILIIMFIYFGRDFQSYVAAAKIALLQWPPFWWTVIIDVQAEPSGVALRSRQDFAGAQSFFLTYPSPKPVGSLKDHH